MSTQTVPDDIRHYLDDVAGERGDALRAVFDVVHAAVPDGYELGVHWGMPTWVIPLETYPITYNKQPLSYVALAAQKQYNSLYLMVSAEEEQAFREAWEATGRSLNMGKSCLRFRTREDVALELIADTVASTPVEQYIATYERSR
jgi:hypothetical protein